MNSVLHLALRLLKHWVARAIVSGTQHGSALTPLTDLHARLGITTPHTGGIATEKTPAGDTQQDPQLSTLFAEALHAKHVTLLPSRKMVGHITSAQTFSPMISRNAVDWNQLRSFFTPKAIQCNKFLLVAQRGEELPPAELYGPNVVVPHSRLTDAIVEQISSPLTHGGGVPDHLLALGLGDTWTLPVGVAAFGAQVFEEPLPAHPALDGVCFTTADVACTAGANAQGSQVRRQLAATVWGSAKFNKIAIVPRGMASLAGEEVAASPHFYSEKDLYTHIDSVVVGRAVQQEKKFSDFFFALASRPVEKWTRTLTKQREEQAREFLQQLIEKTDAAELCEAGEEYKTLREALTKTRAVRLKDDGESPAPWESTLGKQLEKGEQPLTVTGCQVRVGGKKAFEKTEQEKTQFAEKEYTAQCFWERKVFYVVAAFCTASRALGGLVFPGRVEGGKAKAKFIQELGEEASGDHAPSGGENFYVAVSDQQAKVFKAGGVEVGVVYF